MSCEIDWGGERLILMPEKAIAWPRAASLIVADLHLGKPAAFRAAGIPVPESTTKSDLARLDAALAVHASQRLIVLGDFFHSAAGRQAEMMDAVADWLSGKPSLDIILIPGNHDSKAGAPPKSWNIQTVPEGWDMAPYRFHHKPSLSPDGNVFAGHIHPAISLREKFGGGMRVPCFWFQQRCAILPAFGSFTGTHTIRPARADRVFAIGHGEIVDLTSPAAGPKRPTRIPKP